MGLCKLCAKEAQLIKAHVIPEAFLALPSGSDGPAKIMSNSRGVFPKRTPTGIYDSEILCQACDRKLGKLDQHAVEKIFRSRNVSEFRVGHRTVSRVYHDADAELVDKFIVSVLWRASISTHHFFNRVKLGPYDEIIRATLLNNSKRNESVRTILAEFDKTDCSILDPHQTRTDGIRFWVIYANRFILYTKTDQQDTPKGLSEFVLRKGQDVKSIVRHWQRSKEYPLIARIAAASPYAFPSRRRD